MPEVKIIRKATHEMQPCGYVKATMWVAGILISILMLWIMGLNMDIQRSTEGNVRSISNQQKVAVIEAKLDRLVVIESKLDSLEAYIRQYNRISGGGN